MGSNAPTVYVFGRENLAFTTFVERYVPAIDSMLVERDCGWILGDGAGAETLAQEYLKSRTENVSIFHLDNARRYSADINGTAAMPWGNRGFDSHAALGEAALAACTHVIAVDTRLDLGARDRTADVLEQARALGRVDVAAVATTVPSSGRARAHALVDAVDATHQTARSFAHVLVDLFPAWFDFASGRFSVLAWDLGLHLVVAGPSPVRAPAIGVISTSDSRNMTCATLDTFRAGGHVEDISMHYSPSDEHRERAAAAIAAMLRHLYPARADMP